MFLFVANFLWFNFIISCNQC
ncbi:hypothetical protein [Plasmodium yoelii yoelii]|uniref:Uncharacterized protein n=1 Tax=Plasmodium yoelii yoelii TaxID=73239 RepID=Q7RA36_PLAYO|nr:hypothetical protein [Plasmodium yoelii yoelii]